MKRTTILMTAFLCLFGLTESPAQNTHKNMELLNLTQEWDKTFPKSDKVNHSKVTFVNRYGITLAADLYAPKTIFGGKLPAIAVSGPFGAVKEQSSGLYAQTLAERGFLTIAFDPSFTGESGGQPRSVASPDINTEDFSAAVDYLATRPDVDAERIGIIGICGWGGFAINAAANDTRIKATVASTMYDISRCTANGYFDAADNADARYKMRQEFNAQRTEDYRTDTYPRTVPNPEPTGAAIITRPNEVIILVPSTPVWAGTKPPILHFSTHLSLRMPMKSAVPCCSFMEKKLTPAILVRILSRS